MLTGEEIAVLLGHQQGCGITGLAQVNLHEIRISKEDQLLGFHWNWLRNPSYSLYLEASGGHR